MERQTISRRSTTVIVALACAVGAALVLGATEQGIGLSPDSTQYLAVAQSATHGNGLITYAWDAEPARLTHFPPGYPLVLAAAARTGWPPDRFARWLNVALLISTIVIAAGMTRRLAPESWWAPIAVAGLLAVANDLVVAHSMAWTEPLYLTLTLVGLLATARAIDRRSLVLLCVAAALAGSVALVRYIGAANMALVALAALIWWPATWWRRVRTATVASVIAAIPLALWVLSNRAGSESSMANRQIAWHPVDAADVKMFASVVAKWVTPLSDASFLTLIWLLAVAVVAGVVFFLRAREPRVTPAKSHTALAKVCYLYCAVYLTVLALSVSLADAQTEFDTRLLVPILTVSIILGVAWLAEQRSTRFGVRLATGVLLLLVFVAELSRLAPWVREARSEGIGLRRVAETERALVAATSRLPDSAKVYSNRPYFLRVHTSRIVPGLPRQRNPNSLQENPRYAEQLRAMCDTAALRETYVVFFPENESEDATANRYPAASNGDVTTLPGGRIVKLRAGCRIGG